MPFSAPTATGATAPNATHHTDSRGADSVANSAATSTSMASVQTTSGALPTTMLTQGGSNTTSAHLAALLASALSDADALREELGTQKRRTEMTERLLETFNEVTTSMRGETGSGEGQLTVTAGAGFTPTSPGPATTTLGATVSSNKTDTAPTRTLPPETRALLLTLEQRTVLAERGRDEALARLAAAQDIWGQLDEYLIVVEQRAAHARASFTRIVQDGGGPLMLLDIPLPSASPHPHPSYFSSSAHYPSNTSVYPPPAVDPSNSRYPRHRGREEFGGLALPPLPGHEARGRERVHTGEGRASESVARTGSKRQREETMHLPAWGGNSSKKTRRDGWEDEPNHSLPHHSSSATSHLSSTQRPHTYHNSQGERSPSTSDDVDAMLLESAKASPRHPSRFSTHRPFLQHPLSQGDKVKDAVPVFPYPALVKIGPSGVPEATSSSFPALNAQNQRTCRQCGVPGRYKEGKCVEKWGPGPLGPGTVCDRCRKKMKRVERRGTLEQQQQQSHPASGSATPASVISTSFRTQGVRRTDTLPAATVNNAYSNSRNQREPSESSMRSSLAVGRVIQTRVTPAVHDSAAGAPGLLPPLQTRSPIDVDGEDGEGDSLDADAEADVDELGEEYAQDVEGKENRDADGDGDGEGDPEADLLEAVEAAEKASV